MHSHQVKKALMITLIVTITFLGAGCAAIKTAFTKSDPTPDDNQVFANGGLPENPPASTQLYSQYR